MTVDDLLKVLSNPDMIRIINDGSDVYVGYLGTMQYHKGIYQNHEAGSTFIPVYSGNPS